MPFFQALLTIPIGHDLVWEYGHWSFTYSKRKMFFDIQASLKDSLDEDDYTVISRVFPNKVIDLEHAPYIEGEPTTPTAG